MYKLMMCLSGWTDAMLQMFEWMEREGGEEEQLEEH